MSLALDEALRAADLGLYVMPLCRPRPAGGCMDHGKSCAGSNGKPGTAGKKPIVESTTLATTSHRQIEEWWACGDYNVGVKTRESNLIVVDYDVDPKKPQGADWLRKHKREGRQLHTRTHKTHSNGRHWVYRRPTGLNHGDRIVKGLDLRGAGNHHYVVWSGSTGWTGKLYEVIVDSPVLDLPEWIAEEIGRAPYTERHDVFTPSGETVLEKLWLASGRTIHRTNEARDTTRHWVTCILEHEHTTSHKPLDTVLLAGKGVPPYGRYSCAHGSHRLTTYQVVQMLRRELGETVFDDITGAYRERARRERVHLASVDDCTRKLDELFRSIDETRGKIVVVQVTTGIGKTHGARKYLASHGDKPTSMFLPNHALASEVAERMASDYGLNVAHPKGVGSFKETPCVFPGMAEAAAKLKVPLRQDVCRHCPHRKNYQSSGEPCTAGGSSTPMENKHRLLQHATLDAVLRDKTTNADIGLVIVDEQPTLVDAVSIDIGLLTDEKTFDLYGLETQAKNAYVRLAGFLVKARGVFSTSSVFSSGAGGTASYTTARDVVSVGLNGGQNTFGFADESDALVKQIASTPLPSPVEAGARLAQKVTSGLYPDAEVNLRKLTQTYTLLYALQRACMYPTRQTFEFKGNDVTVRVPAAWLVEASHYAAAGGTTLVMSASAHTEVLSHAAEGLVDVHHVHAMDGPCVERRFQYDRNVSRRQMLRNGAVREGVLRDAMRRCLDEVRGLTNVLVVTHKPVADALRQRRKDFLPEAWEKAVEAGARFHVAHYGAVVGLDAWKDVDAVITVGDPIPNLDDARACARALGVEPSEYLNVLVQSELLQAHGRGRACRRQDELRIVHFGIYTPDVRLVPQWERFVLPSLTGKKDWLVSRNAEQTSIRYRRPCEY